MFKSPRKRFGQNFLQDHNVIEKIIAAIRPAEDDLLVEVGPGRGALTLPLLKKCNQLHVIEIDRDLITWWRDQQHDNLALHAVDALKFDFHSLLPVNSHNKKLRVIGNLPYNISTPLLFHLFDDIDAIEDMHFMLQKEVVDRIIASPGSKEYGRLSVMVQYYCEAQKLFLVNPGSFYPAPKVDSAIVYLRPRQQRPACDAKLLGRLVQQAFSQRRKTLRNSLKNWLSTEEILALGIEPSVRAETLSLTDFVRLTQASHEPS